MIKRNKKTLVRILSLGVTSNKNLIEINVLPNTNLFDVAYDKIRRFVIKRDKITTGSARCIIPGSELIIEYKEYPYGDNREPVALYRTFSERGFSKIKCSRRPFYRF